MMPQRNHRRCWWVLAAAVMACVLSATSADALIIVTPKPEQPGNPPALTLSREIVNADLTDRAAEVTVTCTYHNESRYVLEGTYLFPLPPEAAVDDFTLEVNGEMIHAELLDVDQARRTYEEIVRRIKDPALLEYVDRQLLRARVFPIQPNSDVTIRLYYTHPLIADFGTTDFAFPFSIERTNNDSDIRLTASIESNGMLKSVTSPTHDVQVSYHGDHRADVNTPGDWNPGEGDFHLLSTFDTRDLSAQFLTTVDDEGHQYFMGIIAPGETVASEVLPKDVVFCFDRSGSMQGEKIEQARAALKFCLGRLNPEDQFGLLTFNDRIDAFDRALRPATDDAVNAATAFASQMEADGGTNLDGAMVEALHLFAQSDRPKYLVFLTDGLPTVGVRDPKLIRQHAQDANKSEARLFTFGVGYDLNAALLNDLAETGRGLASYVEPGEDVEVKVSNFFRRISRPVLSDCRLEFSGDVAVHDVYPGELPDVFAGTEILVLGRFDGTGPVTARLLGTRAGSQVNHTFNPEFTPSHDRYEFIPKLWAGRRIGVLLEEMRRNGETAEVKDEVVRLSKKYGIMTPYTAFLAAPEEVRMARQSMLPQGQQSNIRGGRGMDMMYMPAPVPDEDAISVPNQAKRDISTATLKASPSISAFKPQAEAFSDMESAEGAGAAVQSVDGRQFTFKDGYWTDWTIIEGKALPTEVINVKPYSEAYFKLAGNPGIARILAVGQPIQFVWRNTIIKIDENGAESWNPDWNRML